MTITTVLLAIACFALSPAALAGNPHGSPTPTPTPTPSPTPVGDRGNENTAIGDGALFNLTSGVNNTAMGFQALFSDTIGNYNTANGYGALYSNSADGNTAYGYQALLSNTTGSLNAANGILALANNTTGDENTANGSGALYSNTIGMQNTANGFGALFYNTTGNYNTAEGVQALEQNTTGSNNTATGFRALYSNSADNNTAYGYQALLSNTTGNYNTATGYRALYNNNVEANTAYGALALQANTTGSQNTAIGDQALVYNDNGYNNTAVGFSALINSGGSNNVALGSLAGINQFGTGLTGNRNIYIGANVFGVDGENDSCYIGSIFGRTSSGGVAVFVNSDGKLGTTTSSRRFKKDIKPMDKASEALLALKPVTFRYKKEIDPQGIPQFGLVAEEVEKVNPKLVVRDREGKVNTVRYEAVNAMLLNEFLKEHKKVEQLETTVAQQRKDMGVITVQLKAQAAQIQKVSGQLAAASQSCGGGSTTRIPPAFAQRLLRKRSRAGGRARRARTN